MILCLVTDRRQLSPDARTDRDAALALARWLEEAVAAGIDLIQIRERDLPGRLLCDMARAVSAMAAGSRTRVVVNDRADVAMAAGADGVHVRGDGPPVPAMRRLAAGRRHSWMVGRSVHSVEEARRHRDADYLVCGAVFGSGDKPARGLEMLRSAVLASGTTPVIAIGGIAAPRVAECVAAGAKGVAAIRVFLPPGRAPEALGVAAGASALRRVVDAAVMGHLQYPRRNRHE